MYNLFIDVLFINKFFYDIINGKHIDNKTFCKIKNTEYKKYSKNKYIHKDNIIDGMYIYLPIPKYLSNISMQQIEIKPIFNGLQYELIIKHTQNKIKLNKNEKNVVSIDLGINNLLTIFGPKIDPFIINGKALKSINQYYNKKIGQTQKKRDNKINILKNKKTKNKILRFYKHKYDKIIKFLFNKRNNQINFQVHQITKFFVNYCERKKIDTVIVGYIKGWKNKCNIGKANTQNFYGLPFLEIINKLRYKLEEKKIKLRLKNESYTSKCDALVNEQVKKQQFKIGDIIIGNYMGKRIRRGLFKSFTKEIINADLNAAINIYRKEFELDNQTQKGVDFNLNLRLNVKKLHRIKKITVKNTDFESQYKKVTHALLNQRRG